MVFWKRGLTARLLTLFVVLTVVPLGTVGLVAYARGRHIIVANLQAHLESVAILKEQEIRRWANHLEHTITWLVTSPQITDAATALDAQNPGDPAYESAQRLLVSELARLAADGRDVASSSGGGEA